MRLFSVMPEIWTEIMEYEMAEKYRKSLPKLKYHRVILPNCDLLDFDMIIGWLLNNVNKEDCAIPSGEHFPLGKNDPLKVWFKDPQKAIQFKLLFL